jgi:hypothetical protein
MSGYIIRFKSGGNPMFPRVNRNIRPSTYGIANVGVPTKRLDKRHYSLVFCAKRYKIDSPVLTASILHFPHRLTWERRDSDWFADAFNVHRAYAGSYRLATDCSGFWQITYRGPEQGASIYDCGFGRSLDAAMTIAESHWRLTAGFRNGT